MSDGPVFRHPTPDDLVVIASIWNDSRSNLPSQMPVTPEEVNAETFLDDDYDPKGAWLAISDGVPVAYANGFVDTTRLAYGLTDSYVELEVNIANRDNGIEEELLKKALDYLRNRGVSAAQIPYYQVDDWKRRLLEKAGFHEVRRYYEMVREGKGGPEEPTFPEDVVIERMPIHGDSNKLSSRIADIRNRSFVDHFNFSPLPEGRIKNFFEATETQLSVTFALREGETVGFVLSEDRLYEDSRKNKREGWVAILGVVGTHRRRGLGRSLLLDSVNWLMSRGVERVMLMVDAENEKALGMYRSAGFDIESVEVLMVKDLQGSAINH